MHNGYLLYFQSAIDATTFEHIDKPIKKNQYDRLIEYGNSLDPRGVTAQSVFEMNGKIYFGYYSIANKEYFIVKF